MPEFIDQEAYAAASEPFESANDANAAIEEFQREVYALRCRLGIKEVVMILQVAVSSDEGVFEPIVTAQFGDIGKAEILAAWALGRASALRQQAVAQAAKHGGIEGVKSMESKR